MVHESNCDYEKSPPEEWKAITTQTEGESFTIRMPKLLPCMRCGSNKITVIKHWFDDDNHLSYRCMCERGHAWAEWLDTEDEAIAAWNERPVCIYSHAKTKPWRRPARDPYSSTFVPRG